MNTLIELTENEVNSLREKLQMLMTAAKGVDIWLNCTGEDADDECFLDCDEEAHFNLGNILKKVGGDFTPHRTSGFQEDIISTITLAAVEHSVCSTPVLMAVKECTAIAEGVQFANEQAWRWIRNMRRISKESGGKGTFEIDGYTEQPVDDESDVPFAFFKSLTDELIVTGNNAEEIFMVGVDEATLQDGRNATPEEKAQIYSITLG